MTQKSIVWITADYFVDVDKALVPYLRDKMGLNIKWYVFCGHDSKVEMPEGIIDRVFRMKNRNRSPKCFMEYCSIFREMGVDKADLIYSDAVSIPFYYPALFHVCKRRTPIVHGAHNVIPYPVWPASLKWYVRYIFRFNSHFQLFSKFTAQYFKEHYPKKSMFYAPMTVKDFGPVSTDNYQLDETKVNLLFFGNVVANKRLDLLIDAIKGLPSNIQERIHLNICGKCNEADRYLKQIDGCKAISIYFKRIDDCEIAELFTKNQFFMLPYQDVAQSGPHMIAYNYNLPVIATDIEGFAERVEDGKNGFLFHRNDEESLRQAIIKAASLSNEEYSQLKANLAKYTAENFSVEVVAKKYVEYFNSI